jgi:hypothetical protein
MANHEVEHELPNVPLGEGVTPKVVNHAVRRLQALFRRLAERGADVTLGKLDAGPLTEFPPTPQFDGEIVDNIYVLATPDGSDATDESIGETGFNIVLNSPFLPTEDPAVDVVAIKNIFIRPDGKRSHASLVRSILHLSWRGEILNSNFGTARLGDDWIEGDDFLGMAVDPKYHNPLTQRQLAELNFMSFRLGDLPLANDED